MPENITTRQRKEESDRKILKRLVKKLVELDSVKVDGELESANNSSANILKVTFTIPSGILTIEDLTP